MSRSLHLALAASFLAVSAVPAADLAKPARRYDITPIVVPANPRCEAGFATFTYTRRMNEQGEIVGYTDCYAPTEFPETPFALTPWGFAWSPASGGRILPSVAADAFGTFGRGVNEFGIVVGYEFSDRGDVSAPVWFTGGEGYLTQNFPCNGLFYAAAEDINDRGSIAIRAHRGGPDGCTRRWVLRLPNGEEIVGSPRGQLSAINESDVLAGSSAFNAVTWSPTAGEALLGPNRTTRFETAHAWNINDGGQAVGEIRHFDAQGQCLIANDAAIWEADGTERVLPALPGHTHATALGVSDCPLVVGRSLTPSQCNGFDAHMTSRAVIWGDNGVKDLNKLLSARDQRRIQLTSASAVNYSGQIAAYGFYRDEAPAPCPDEVFNEETGEVIFDMSRRCQPVHAFLLTPRY
jgi:uncharacterized membrane protein